MTSMKTGGVVCISIGSGGRTFVPPEEGTRVPAVVGALPGLSVLRAAEAVTGAPEIGRMAVGSSVVGAIVDSRPVGVETGLAVVTEMGSGGVTMGPGTGGRLVGDGVAPGVVVADVDGDTVAGS